MNNLGYSKKLMVQPKPLALLKQILKYGKGGSMLERTNISKTSDWKKRCVQQIIHKTTLAFEI